MFRSILMVLKRLLRIQWKTGGDMFSSKMFRLSPTFQVFYSTKILRGSYRYWGRYQIRSLTTVHEFYKDRANQLGGPIQVTLH